MMQKANKNRVASIKRRRLRVFAELFFFCGDVFFFPRARGRACAVVD